MEQISTHKLKCYKLHTVGVLDKHPIYPNQDLNFHVPLLRQMFLLPNSLGEAYPPNCTIGYDTKGFRMDYGKWMH